MGIPRDLKSWTNLSISSDRFLLRHVMFKVWLIVVKRGRAIFSKYFSEWISTIQFGDWIYMYGLLTMREVKKAGYWPSSLCSSSSGVEVNKSKTNNEFIIQLSWPKRLVNKRFIMLQGKGSSGTRQVVPSRQDRIILPARVANHSTGFGSPCQLTQLAI